MVEFYRGTNFKVLARNLEGDVFRNKSNNYSQMSITTTFKLALRRYANHSVQTSDYLALLSEFKIPEEKTYTMINQENGYDKLHTHDELERKAEKGEQVVWRKDEMADKWNAPFLKVKYLDLIYEVPSKFDSRKELSQKSNKIPIKGNKNKLKKYLKKRKS